MAYSNNQYSGYQNQNQNYNQNYNQQYNNYCPYDSQAAAASSNGLVSENYNSNSPYYPQSSYNNHDQNPFSSSNQVNSSNLNTPYQDYQDDGRTPELAAEAGSATMFDRPSDTGYVSSYPPNGSYGAGTGDNKSKKGWVIGGVIGLLAIIGIAAGLGYYFSHRDSSSSNSSSSNKGTKSTGDPSGFEKNSTYKQSFWGMAYSPIGSQISEGCTNTLDSVIYDMQVLSQLTTHVRGYGTDCNQTAQILQAIKETKTNLTYWAGIYLAPSSESDQETLYDLAVGNLTQAFTEYGTDNIGGVAVGNEFLLNDGTVTELLSYVTKFRATAKTNGWTFPIGTGDAASKFSATLGKGIDFWLGNNHPWFAEVTVQQAPGWTWNYWQESAVQVAATLSNPPALYIGEVGWPSQANDTADATLGNAVASTSNLQYFIDNYACQSTANKTLSFFFELYDEQWKEAAYGGVEGYWGLFDKDKNMKDLTFPDCN